MRDPATCEAYLWVGDEPVPCHLTTGHKVQHSGTVTEGLGGTVRWSESPRRAAPRQATAEEIRRFRDADGGLVG